jgi:hypothetical protein
MVEVPDLWWLSDEERHYEWSVGVGHHSFSMDGEDRPLTIPDHIDQDRPVLLSWDHSLAEDGNASVEFRLYPISFLNVWRGYWENANVYRTMRLFCGTQTTMGPLLIDIDSQNWAQPEEEELEATLTVARRSVDLLAKKRLVPTLDFRVFFSGRKGFNVEVKPSVLGITGSFEQQIRLSADLLVDVIRDVSPDDRVGPPSSSVWTSLQPTAASAPSARRTKSGSWRSYATKASLRTTSSTPRSGCCSAPKVR